MDQICAKFHGDRVWIQHMRVEMATGSNRSLNYRSPPNSWLYCGSHPSLPPNGFWVRNLANPSMMTWAHSVPNFMVTRYEYRLWEWIFWIKLLLSCLLTTFTREDWIEGVWIAFAVGLLFYSAGMIWPSFYMMQGDVWRNSTLDCLHIISESWSGTCYTNPIPFFLMYVCQKRMYPVILSINVSSY